MTRADHLSGTDRVAEAASAVDAEIVVNIQGDEPLIDPAAIDAGRVFVATDLADRSLGVADCCALPEPGAFDLLHLFVDPQGLRQGVGRALFEAACIWCLAQGGTKLMILSDPNAADFYRRMGARLIGEAPSDAMPDRNLPLLEFRLAR